jgi:hypothetical protein
MREVVLDRPAIDIAPRSLFVRETRDHFPDALLSHPHFLQELIPVR